MSVSYQRPRDKSPESLSIHKSQGWRQTVCIQCGPEKHFNYDGTRGRPNCNVACNEVIKGGSRGAGWVPAIPCLYHPKRAQSVDSTETDNLHDIISSSHHLCAFCSGWLICKQPSTTGRKRGPYQRRGQIIKNTNVIAPARCDLFVINMDGLSFVSTDQSGATIQQWWWGRLIDLQCLNGRINKNRVYIMYLLIRHFGR